jgi:hypothetical protein
VELVNALVAELFLDISLEILPCCLNLLIAYGVFWVGRGSEAERMEEHIHEVVCCVSLCIAIVVGALESDVWKVDVHVGRIHHVVEGVCLDCAWVGAVVILLFFFLWGRRGIGVVN